jgi:hypothetical protein
LFFLQLSGNGFLSLMNVKYTTANDQISMAGVIKLVRNIAYGA